MRVSAIYQFREFTAAGALMRSDASLKRPQEINDVLLLLSSQPIETVDDLICLAAITLVISDGCHQVGRSSIMEEEDALSDAPERSGSELVGAGTTLRDAVGEAFAHVVDEKVGVKIRRSGLPESGHGWNAAPKESVDVRFRWKSRRAADIAGTTEFDPERSSLRCLR